MSKMHNWTGEMYKKKQINYYILVKGIYYTMLYYAVYVYYIYFQSDSKAATKT